MIKLYNTLSRSKETFVPINPNEVKLYACGITVYDECHLGHASQAIIFDVLRNFLEFSGYKVTYIRNYTDIDDKIINKANQQGRTAKEVSEFYINDAQKDMAALKVALATFEPKVSENMSEIIDFIARLISLEFAYVANGDVLFDVTKDPQYGKLSNRKIDELLSEEISYKKSPFDFALWKASKPGEPSWSSPWGEGRPGWHIECSAMAKKYLGETFDIHGGGLDLVFPHHENEVAQSECCHGKPFANYWLHNGLVMVNNQKMSKSLGNFYTIKKALSLVPADVIRFLVLSSQYSSNVDFMEDNLIVASKRVYYFYKTLEAVDALLEKHKDTPIETSSESEQSHKFLTEFIDSMSDDLNTPKVMAILSEQFRLANEMVSPKRPLKSKEIAFLREFRSDVVKISEVLRVLDESPRTILEHFKDLHLTRIEIDRNYINNLIEQRQAARTQKDFAKADELRNGLLKLGIQIKDSSTGTDWDVDFRAD